MKYSLVLVALLGMTQAATNLNQLKAEPCEEALDVSQEELDIQLDYFSRRLDMKYYENAMKIYSELKKQGKNPKVAIHTFELYDAGFSFPRVRRYDFVNQALEAVQHYQDNLNQNFTNGLHVANFLKAAKATQKSLNDKYHDGEFSDPANFDPLEEHKVTWSNVKL